MINKKKRYFEFAIMILVMTIGLVSAVAFTSDYQTLAPAKVAPGETKEVVFGRLQNMDEEDASVELELIEGSEVASIRGRTSLTVPAGTRDTEVKIKVSIPEEAVEGTTYKVVIKIQEAAPEEGMVTLTKSNTVSIPILVEKSEVEGISTTWIILGIVLIAIVIAIIWFIRKRNSR